MITRPKKALGGGPSARAVRSCVQEFLRGGQRMRMLKDAYEGKHGILTRTRPDGMPNVKLVHDFPRYISTMAAGYLVGRPVSYESDQQDALNPILERYRRCAADSVDAELARSACIYGRGVELIFADGEAQPRTASIDPAHAFVVYDDTVENKPLFGVHILPRMNELGEETGLEIRVYTDHEELTFAAGSLGEVGALKSRKGHFFGGVPMIEYWNGEDERGDFEGVLTLIDAYDRLQSDRVNDKSQFVDALLLLYGCSMETDEKGRTPGQQLREDKLLALPDSDARAEWLCKQMGEADVEVLKIALASDIHKLSMVPDLTQERMGENLSGVAMRYRLLGLEQLTGIKERWFREALRARLTLFARFMEMRGCPRLDVESVNMVFTRSLPVNGLEQVQLLDSLRGLVDEEALKQRAEQIGI